MSTPSGSDNSEMSSKHLTVQLSGAEHRSYQVKTAAALLDDRATNHVINIPVGGGKTETIIEYIAAAANDTDEYSALIVCPNRRLETQWYDRFDAYGVTDVLTIERSKTADTGNRRSNTHFRSRDTGGKKLQSRADRIKQWENDNFSDGKQTKVATADVFLTTPELLRSDLSRNRLSVSDLHSGFTDIIIDEVTNVLAVQDFTFSFTDDSYESDTTYRLNKNYEPYTNAVRNNDPAVPRLIGLTGLIGDRIDVLQSMFSAKIIRPSLSAVNQHRPTLTRVDPHFATDQRVVAVLEALENRYRGVKDDIVQELIKTGDAPDGQLTIHNLRQYTNRDDTVAALAANALKIQTLLSRVQEGTYESLRPHHDELRNPIARHDHLIDDDGTHRLDTAFTHGRVAGADETRDKAKLQSEPRDPENASWTGLFPTMKAVGLRNLHTKFQRQNQQSLVFVRHVETATALPRILPGRTEVITGDVSRDKQESLLDAYTDGDIDTLYR